MKKLKITDSDLRLLILLGALIVFACAYFFGFNTFNKKASAVEEQNETKQVRLDELESMVAREAEVEADTKEKKEAIEKIIAKYPSKITTEKIISIVQELEDTTKIKISQMNFVLDNQFADVAASQVLDPQAQSEDGTTTDSASAAATAAANKYYGSFASVAMNYEADYDTLKRTIDAINQSEDKKSIATLATTFSNEGNNLTGTLMVYFYTLDGTGKTYENPVVNEEKGVSNIFRSGSSSPSANQ